ncbi:hypothetical protein K461DRAFT_268922 [Myriangium duriaei CBS 260.36]|uniref:RING-type E3 ubiquitin transferase n=1 Tax=Myriangium duriaei CBS 260.36 TaxID=1168546 RepID=A0A9P4IXN5_9PEZI|nr:hypothetical protein K461DRAFT_268922 [Myriangium duriaei CBS 260.36]
MSLPQGVTSTKHIVFSSTGNAKYEEVKRNPSEMTNLSRARSLQQPLRIISIRPEPGVIDGDMSIRSGSVVLPEWQDDSEVSACPICRRNFHFLFRKHHCRRCGRIICDQCSPHRITLPRQYIVRPPWEAVPYRIDTDGDDTEFSNPALGGGETVRVCNPCVPDPNYGPPPQQQQQFDETPSRAPSHDITFPPYDYRNDPNRASTFHSPQRSPDRTQPDRYRSIREQTSPTRRPRESRPYFSHHHHTNSGAALPASEVLEARFRRRANRVSSDAPSPTSAQPIPPPNRTPRHHPSGSAPPAYALLADRSTPTSTAPWDSASPSRRLRITGYRRALDAPPPEPVREEDECPVCGTHAPPFGPNGDQALREQHIESCISSHLVFSSTPRSTPLPPESAAGTPAPAGAAGSFNAARMPQLIAGSPAATPPPTGRPRAPTHPHQRMLTYHATEKDCHDDGGNVAECVICLDDFEPGQEMGRLECLCKFHRSCIRGWWESGPGREKWGTCPTHALSAA